MLRAAAVSLAWAVVYAPPLHHLRQNKQAIGAQAPQQEQRKQEERQGNLLLWWQAQGRPRGGPQPKQKPVAGPKGLLCLRVEGLTSDLSQARGHEAHGFGDWWKSQARLLTRLFTKLKAGMGQEEDS